MGAGDLGVVVVGGGGADDQLGALQVLGPVADGNVHAQGAQMLHCGALVHVGAGDDHAHAVEHLGQRSHGHAADAHQVGVAAGDKVILNIKIRHREHSLFQNNTWPCSENLL